MKNLDLQIQKLIERNTKKFVEINKKKCYEENIFSDMSDWNPAEIIGDRPHLLDYSLYDFLIMKRIWHRSRAVIGYQNIEPYPLMVRFGNKPYVDVRGSFNSLIPNNIHSQIKRMNGDLKKIREENEQIKILEEQNQLWADAWMRGICF